MAYTTFSTDNANYVLQLGNHITRNTQVDIFEGIDALVVETGMGKLQDFVDTTRPYHPQHKLPIQYCVDNQIPIFGTDTRPTMLGLSRHLLSIIGISYINWPMSLLMISQALYYSFREKKFNESILRLNSYWNYLLQEPEVEGRNAIIARKTEEFVAPLLEERLERKPFIGMIYGGFHMGLKPDLQSKRRRDFTIWNWRNLNFGKWAGFVQEDLNLVDEANYNGEEWAIQTYDTNLFD